VPAPDDCLATICDRVLAAIVWPLRERSGHELDGGRGVVRSCFRTTWATRDARPDSAAFTNMRLCAAAHNCFYVLRLIMCSHQLVGGFFPAHVEITG
jgi:hypothetical protein